MEVIDKLPGLYFNVTKFYYQNLGAIFGAARLKTKHRKLYQQHYLPWALKNGRSVKPLMNVYWEKRWEQDISDIRKELCIELLPPPPPPANDSNV
jgi:ubiquinone biosynthesis protein Coq4